MQVPGWWAVMAGWRIRRRAGWMLVPVLRLLGPRRLLGVLRLLRFLGLVGLLWLCRFLALRRLLLQMPERQARVLRLLLQMPERMSRRRSRLGGRARDGLRSGDRNAGTGGRARGRLGLGFRCRLRAGGARGLLRSGGSRSRRNGGHRCSRATRCRRSRRPRGGVSRRRDRPVRPAYRSTAATRPRPSPAAEKRSCDPIDGRCAVPESRSSAIAAAPRSSGISGAAARRAATPTASHFVRSLADTGLSSPSRTGLPRPSLRDTRNPIGRQPAYGADVRCFRRNH